MGGMLMIYEVEFPFQNTPFLNSLKSTLHGRNLLEKQKWFQYTFL